MAGPPLPLRSSMPDYSLGITASLLRQYAGDVDIVACALNPRRPLLTLDRRLAVAAARLGVPTLEVNP